MFQRYRLVGEDLCRKHGFAQPHRVLACARARNQPVASPLNELICHNTSQYLCLIFCPVIANAIIVALTLLYASGSKF